jgi:hypothetical protein
MRQNLLYNTSQTSFKLSISHSTTGKEKKEKRKRKKKRKAWKYREARKLSLRDWYMVVHPLSAVYPQAQAPLAAINSHHRKLFVLIFLHALNL